MKVSGKNVAYEILKENKNIKSIYLLETFDDKKILSLIEKNNLNYNSLNLSEFNKLGEVNTQGIVIEIEDYQFYDFEQILKDESSKFIVVLDHLEDAHNFGAIIRTCESAGVDYIIIPNKRSVTINSTVMKTSSGALTNVKIVEVSNLVNSIKKLKQKGYWVVGAEADGENYKNIDMSGKIVLVIGSEGNGLKYIIRQNCDFIASIPMNGKINSLNASVAAGILIYEVISRK